MTKHFQRGFTLIELLMVIMIIAVISVVVGKILFQSVISFTISQNISEADWQGFVALENMANDVHNIRSTSDISTMTATQLNFIDANGTSVQYSLSSGLLLRNGQTLANGITSIVFGYLDKNGTVTATASSVRYVSLALTLTQGTITTSFSTLVGTRGLP